MLDNSDWKYLAATIDTDGYLQCQLNRHYKQNGRIVMSYIPRLKVDMTSKDFIYNLKNTYGCGLIFPYDSARKRLFNQRTSWIWLVGNGNARNRHYNLKNILEHILPYLIIKKKHALLLIELTKINDARMGKFNKYRQAKPNYRGQEIWAEIKALNRRGI